MDTNILAAAVMAALGDPTRRAVFERLANGPRSVAQIALGLPVTRSAVSQHLRVLKNAGLVYVTRQGTRNVYALSVDGLDAVRQYFNQFWKHALTTFKRAAEAKPKE